MNTLPAISYPSFQETYKKLLKDQADARKALKTQSELYTKLVNFLTDHITDHKPTVTLHSTYISIDFRAHENEGDA